MLSQIFGGGEHSIELKPLPDGVDAIGPTGPITTHPPFVAARERAAAARGEKEKPMEPGKWTLKVTVIETPYHRALARYRHIVGVVRTHAQVYVIRCAELAARDASGTSDPFVTVTAFGQRQQTSLKSKNCDPVYDEKLMITAADATAADLELGVLTISVLDSDALGFSAFGGGDVRRLLLGGGGREEWALLLSLLCLSLLHGARLDGIHFTFDRALRSCFPPLLSRCATPARCDAPFLDGDAVLLLSSPYFFFSLSRFHFRVTRTRAL